MTRRAFGIAKDIDENGNTVIALSDSVQDFSPEELIEIARHLNQTAAHFLFERSCLLNHLNAEKYVN